jgi:hypothetical protein
MTSAPALHVNRNRHAGDMGRKNFGMNSQGSCPAAVSHWANAKIVNSL